MKGFKKLFNKKYEELSETDKMVISLKKAINMFKEEDQDTKKAFLGAYIAHTTHELKRKGISI